MLICCLFYSVRMARMLFLRMNRKLSELILIVALTSFYFAYVLAYTCGSQDPSLWGYDYTGYVMKFVKPCLKFILI